MVVERFTNGKTYRVRDLGTEQERQVTREQVRVLDVPIAWEADSEQQRKVLPQMKHVELGEGVYVPQDVCADKVATAGPAVHDDPPPFEDAMEPDRKTRRATEARGTIATLEARLEDVEPVGRYALRQVPERRALQAEKRRRHEL